MSGLIYTFYPKEVVFMMEENVILFDDMDEEDIFGGDDVEEVEEDLEEDDDFDDFDDDDDELDEDDDFGTDEEMEE